MKIVKQFNGIIKTFSSLVFGKKYLEVLLVCVFAMQFFALVYFNLRLIENHMGFDSSCFFLKAAMIWNEKSIVSDIWTDTTNAALDGSVLFASLLYGITGKLLSSYGCVNVIILIFVLLCLNSVLKLLQIDLKARLFAFNLVICPYLTNGFGWRNDLGYLSNLLANAAFYNLRTLIFLLVIREFLCIRKNGKIDVLGYVALVLCTLTGVSSGIYLIVILFLPYLLFVLEQVFLKNDTEYLFKSESIYAYAGTVFVIAGKIIGKYVLGVSAFDATRTWTPLTRLFTNFGAPLQGFMQLLGVLPVNSTTIKIFSVAGITRIFPILIFLVIITSVGYAVKKIYTDVDVNHGELLFLVNIVAVNYLVFGLYNVRYGEKIFEVRYLITTFMVIIIIVAYFLQNISADLLFTKVISGVLLICLLCNNYVSDKIYLKSTNDSARMAEIMTVVDSQNARVIYLWNDKLNIWSDKLFYVGNVMRAYDLNHVYKVIKRDGSIFHWGDYKYFDDISDYNGSTLLITSEKSKVVPKYIMDEYIFIKKIGDMSIYKSDSNPVDGSAGITGTVSVDFPSTPGYRTRNGKFEGRSFISDGKPGCIMWGPNSKTADGIFDFVLDYEILEGNTASFDIAIDGGKERIGICKLDASAREATLKGIPLKSGHNIECRVFSEEGTKIKVNKITIRKKG